MQRYESDHAPASLPTAKPEEVLGPLVTSLGQKPDQLDGLGAAALGTILYELYRLDVWDEVVPSA